MADDDVGEHVRRSMGTVEAALASFNRRLRTSIGDNGVFVLADKALGSMAKSMLGPVGVAAGFIGVAKALESVISSVATSSVQLQAFSRNTGMSSENIKDFQIQMRMMGKTSAEAMSSIASINGLLTDFETNREGSALSKSMLGRDGGADFLRRLGEAKDRMGQIKVILDTFNSGDERQKRGFAEAINIDVHTLENLQIYSGLLKNAFRLNEEELAKYHRASVLFEHNVSEVWKAIAGNAVLNINKITEGVSVQGEVLKDIVTNINAFVDEGFERIKTTMQEFQLIKSAIEKIKGDDPAEAKQGARSLFGKSPIGAWADLTPAEMFTGKRYEQYGPEPPPEIAIRRFHGPALWQIKPRDPVGTGTSGMTDFGGMRRTQDIEGDSNRTLIDIRDILYRMETKEEGGSRSGVSPLSSGAGGTLSGGGRGALGGRLGMYTGGGGGTAGVGPTAVGKGGDPRGMEGYIRETAQKYGIDPDTAVAVAKSEGLASFQSSVIQRDGSREKSWGAFQLYTGGGLGNDFQKETGLDPSDPANEKATIDYALKHASKKGWGAFHGAKNTGIGPRAGIGVASPQPGSGSSVFSGTSFGGSVLERQGAVAGVRKGKLDAGLRTALDYASSKTGLTADVTSGGQRMRGAPGAIGSHRHDDGRAADFNLRDAEGNIVSPNDPRAIEFYRYAGQGGVTGGGEGYMSDPNKIHLDRAGGVYAGSSAFRAAIARGQREQNEFQEAARSRIDTAAAKAAKVTGSLNAKIDFSGVPTGVKTSVEAEGFEDLQISKSKQGEVAGGSPGQPFSGVW